jgi:transcriptional regulator
LDTAADRESLEMYIPSHFVENDLTVLRAAIKRLQFGNLVTLNGQSLLATQMPMFIDDQVGHYGLLEGHISRANQQWTRLTPSIHALAMFSGPNTYISPGWYPGKKEHGKVVPTWNYIAIHAYGPLEIIEDKKWLRNHVKKLTNNNEKGRHAPWSITDAPRIT